jgi:glyoxylase-like metal-dependent hydrolase (beta-lactamase superfamily II)/ferredoxin
MADPSRRVAANVAGPLFVDDTCIDCGTCMWMAPETYAERGGQSAVIRQPETDDDAALAAIIACPTASIGMQPLSPRLGAVRVSFPRPMRGGVYHMGYHDEQTFGAASWLVATPQGNVLIDVPRFAGPLVRRVEEMGGITRILLTHRDDVGDHAKWAKRFAAPRVLHRDDASRATTEVEVQPEGVEPFEAAPGVLGIPVPGHTKGHVVYLAGTDLFTGDHLAWLQGRLVAFRRACWYSWPEQIKSMQRLAAYSFTRIFPGHGAPGELPAGQEEHLMQDLIAWMQAKT